MDFVFDRQGIRQDGQRSHQEQRPGIGVYLDRSVLQRVTMSGGELHEAGLRKYWSKLFSKKQLVNRLMYAVRVYVVCIEQLYKYLRQ